METDLHYVIRRLTEFASYADRVDNSIKLDVSTVLELKRLLERAAELLEGAKSSIQLTEPEITADVVEKFNQTVSSVSGSLWSDKRHALDVVSAFINRNFGRR